MAEYLTTIRKNGPAYGDEEEEFFSAYRWCINPFLTLHELWNRLEQEIGRLGTTTALWQEREVRLNIYLFACAISCTVDDYFSRRLYIKPLADRVGKLKPLVWVAEDLINLALNSGRNRHARHLSHWRSDMNSMIEDACRLLLSSGAGFAPSKADLLVRVRRLSSRADGPEMSQARMRLNEGFRCQDLTPWDIVTLASKFRARRPDKNSLMLILGARTAGSYFAPLIKVYLEMEGYTDVHWATVRPKYGAHGPERKKLKDLLRRSPTVILTDDYSNTGHTFKMLEDVALELHADPDKMVVLAPVHPVREAHGREDLERKMSADGKITVISIVQDDLHLKRAMEPKSVEKILSEIVGSGERVEVNVMASAWTEETNRELSSHYSDSFQVRLKRVHEVSISQTEGGEVRKKIIAKSVGVGWLGYHAYFAAKALREFVPHGLALREGILFMEWVEGRPVRDDEPSDDTISHMANYIANRATKLSLGEDQRTSPPYLSWGWLEILGIFRRVYNAVFGYLKHVSLLHRLKRALPNRPALVDGRMGPGEWLKNEDGIFKTDFEGHCFGAPELDVVDPAYDIAVSAFEFRLDAAKEDRLATQYSRVSGDDHDIVERVFVYKLLYATAEAERSLHRLMAGMSGGEPTELNQRVQWSWDFRVYSMNRFCSQLLSRESSDANGQPTQAPKHGIFFMDLDGVFDSEILGFPHTTVHGLEAIALLRASGYTVIPNTGRSAAHVNNYCTNYGFRAGIAEYGSVIVDASTGREISLVENEDLKELEECRKTLVGMDGIFVDPGYRYSLRSYRYKENRTAGLSLQEAERILNEHGLSRLKVIARGADTYFIVRTVDKRSAAIKLTELLDIDTGVVAAIGDSDEDVPLLGWATHVFAPANCSRGILALAKAGKCRVSTKKRQSGLLDAVLRLTASGRSESELFRSFPPESLQRLIMDLLTVADYPLSRRILAAIKPSRLL